jgi:type IV secretory pathway TraG/TraD family ATPase VirD4
VPRGAARLYLGAGLHGPAWAGAEQAVLVLGPPRSGKTSALIVPTVLGASGAVVSTSTKPDVLAATVASRETRGRCWLFDPSGTVSPPPGVEPVRWSPIGGCTRWDDALLVARAMVAASRDGARHAEIGDHWSERAGALLAPLLHAAAVGGEELPTVLSWIDRRQAAPALRVLDETGAAVAGDLLAGIAATDAREQSGIWSTASGVLAAYRSDAARATTMAADFDARRFCESESTLYICATGRHQALAAPLVVGLLAELRSAAYEAHGRAVTAGRPRPAPLVLALDEVANIAPLPDLPALVSEGGGQGVLTMACLQDLSQARVRWGEAADGFLSLFGTTVVLPGIGDIRTLEALSALAGTGEVEATSVTRPVPVPSRGLGAAVAGRLLASATGRRPLAVAERGTVTASWQRQPRLPVDEIGRGRPGMAVVVDERNALGWVRLTPWYAHEPWRTMGRGLGPGRRLEGPELGF